MLKNACINPEIMKALAFCGHGDKILIADGNYPLESQSGTATKVYLGLTSGSPEVTRVLEILRRVVNIEKAEVMLPEGEEPSIFGEFRKILGDTELKGLERFEYYSACCKPEVRLAISTGENRTFANILLTIGVA